MKQNETTQSFDVIIIGGGATGAGTARDCSRRGIKHFYWKDSTSQPVPRGEITAYCTVEPVTP